MIHTVLDALARNAAATPDRLAFELPDERLTWAELAAGARTAAAALHARGVGPGDRVALALPTGGAFLRALFGAQLLGAVPVAINPSLPPDAIARRLARVATDLLVTSADGPAPPPAGAPGAPRLGAATPDALRTSPPAPPNTPNPLTTERAPRPDDLAYLQLTSGTTGDSQAAALTHRSLMASLDASRRLVDATADDVLVSWVPLHHDLGLVRFVFFPVYLGATCHLLTPALANLGAWLRTIGRVRATLTGAPDFAYRIAARAVDPAGVDLTSLRVATNGGEPVRRSTIEAFEGRFNAPGRVLPGYGLAEATLGVTGVRPGEALRVDNAGNVSCGRPLHGLEVRVRSASDGAVLGANEPGAIEVRGAPIFSGYYGDEAATRAAFTDDGWLRTGDTGVVDDEGYLYVLGRSRAMIKRAGALVAPRELEEVCDRVSGVRLSAAVGVPGAGTEDVVLVVEARPEAVSEPAARATLRAAIAAAVTASVGFAPGRVVFAPPRGIPLTANGKIRHAALRERLLAGDLRVG